MRKIRVMLAVLVGCIALSITAFADEGAEWNEAIENLPMHRESVLLPEGINKSTDYGSSARGNYLGSAGLSLTNKGYNILGIYADTTCHVPVKRIRMSIFLDRWDENEQDWFQVDAYNFSYEHKEGGEDITFVSEDFNVSGFPADNYYRLRSFHAVWPFTGGVEMQGPMTNGLKLTDGPSL